MGEIEPKPLNTDFDARRWAKEFNETLIKLGHQPHDRDFLIAWFANAIMAGYDNANQTIRKAQAWDKFTEWADKLNGTDDKVVLDHVSHKRLKQLVEEFKK